MPSPRRHVLGISGLYHDSAAALVTDGLIVAAAQEERFSRLKNDARLPFQAIRYCLDEGGLRADDLDAIVFYDNPVLSLDRALTTFLSVAPRGRERWREFADSFLAYKLLVARDIRRRLDTRTPIHFTQHHLSHAASAFYPSPFEDAAILTIDGVGEWETATIARGEREYIQPLKSIHFPNSLGLLYSAFTHFCGFDVNSDEYKLMGLAPYGSPRFADAIRKHLIHFERDGSFRLNMDYFGFLDGDRLSNPRFEALFGGPARRPQARITRREMDMAASIQLVTQDAVLALARQARAVTGSRNLCLAGGVALNCVANGLLARENIFDRIWIQPAAGDAGGALGAALLGTHLLLSTPRRLPGGGSDAQQGSLLGPGFPSDGLRAELEALGCAFDAVADRTERARRIAERLAAGDIVALCSGRMEFGPRALGSRSILADPRPPDTQTRLNLKVKFRESFRPFAPAVLAESCSAYFEFESTSPYMLMTAPVRHERRLPTDRSAPVPTDDDLLAIVRQVRSDVPAITHVDHSARLQTVGPGANPEFHAILSAFHELTGCPLLVNTSFNVRGEPVVCTPQDAWSCFKRTDIDLLVVEDLIIAGKPKPAGEAPPKRPSGTAASSPPSSSSRAPVRVDLFFRLMLVPVAERDGAAFVSRLGGRKQSGSSYCPPETAAVFCELESLEAIGTMLRQRWTERSLGGACELVSPLLELAEELIDARTEDNLGAVTPYIYTLF
jgi:carbamoyltransferase